MKTLLIILLCFLTFSTIAPHRAAFEYKIENGVSEGKINSLAADGWEVVTAGNYNGGMPYVILRRPKQ